MRRVIAFLMLSLMAAPAMSERVKDIARVNGVRSNPLIGYGLVVGLNGTGDQTSQAPFTVQSLKTMLAELGVTIPPGVNPQLTWPRATSVKTPWMVRRSAKSALAPKCFWAAWCEYEPCGPR